MLRYVKFVSGPLKEKKKVVSTCIQNFKKDTHRRIMKYLVTQGENVFPAIVLLLADSKKEMEEMIAKKRTCSVPSHLLQSAPEDENSDNGRNNLKRSKSSLINQDVSDTQDKLLEDKSSEIDVNTQSLTDMCEKNIETAKSRNVHQTYETEGSSEFECISEEDEQVEENLLCTKSFSPTRKIQKLLRDESEQADNIKVHKSVTQKKSNAKAVIKTICKVHPVTECKVDFDKLNSKYITLKEENCKIKEKIKELKKENEKIRHNRSDMRKKLEEQTCELRKLRELNENLQVTIIEKFQERDAMVEKLYARESILYEDNYPPIGTLRTSDNCRRIHIGRDQWIHEAGYSTLLNTAKSPRQCASSILTLVFDLEILLTSTISGFESNKKQLGKKACPKLDPVKFGACVVGKWLF
ncbi:uncharacterized protein [Temnothorax nylanderi]|uniref:uncharacterized protein isoform X2 n=1 Tax=Temnothorax nylanderi TaxID=102681 RepID=UPI003A86CB8B